MVKIDQFFEDAAAGDLPSFSLVEPNYDEQSEENPQDIQYGDQFVGKVVNAVMSSPNWPKTMLIWTYDEHGGYYDHVPPPAAIPPDDVAPALEPGDPPGGFDRYGFRVPCAVVSPYAKKDYVSHEVYDHTSILKTVEEKWNLPALTRRDANANSLFDMLDLHGKPAFLKPPKLPAAPNPDDQGRVPDDRCRHHPPAIGRLEGLREDQLARGRVRDPASAVPSLHLVRIPSRRSVWAPWNGVRDENRKRIRPVPPDRRHGRRHPCRVRRHGDRGIEYIDIRGEQPRVDHGQRFQMWRQMAPTSFGTAADFCDQRRQLRSSREASWGVDDPSWTGFLRVEFALWQNQPASTVAATADQLDAYVHQLVVAFPEQTIPSNDLSLRTHEI